MGVCRDALSFGGGANLLDLRHSSVTFSWVAMLYDIDLNIFKRREIHLYRSSSHPYTTLNYYAKKSNAIPIFCLQ